MENLLHYQQLESTNTFLERLVQTKNHATENTLADGYAVCADFQTAGRGRRCNTWFSEEGKNLLISILLYPNIAIGEQFRVSEWVSLTVSDFLLKHADLSARIKWPNDIYIGKHKIAGILVAHHWSGERLSYSIVGIGLNLNQDAFPDYLPNPTSVLQETGKHLSVKTAALSMRDGLLLRKQQDPEKLHREYLQQLYLLRENANYRDLRSGESFQGQIVNVTPKGLLQLRCGTVLREFELNGIAYL